MGSTERRDSPFDNLLVDAVEHLNKSAESLLRYATARDLTLESKWSNYTGAINPEEALQLFLSLPRPSPEASPTELQSIRDEIKGILKSHAASAYADLLLDELRYNPDLHVYRMALRVQGIIARMLEELRSRQS